MLDKKKHTGLIVTLSVIGAVVVLGILGAALGGSTDTNKPDLKQTNTSQQAAAPAQETSEATQAPDKISFANVTYKDDGYGFYTVVGEATNNDKSKHGASLTATFYDANNKILGTAMGAVTDIEAGQTKTFSLSGNDQVNGYANIKVQVDTLL